MADVTKVPVDTSQLSKLTDTQLADQITARMPKPVTVTNDDIQQAFAMMREAASRKAQAPVTVKGG